MAKIKKKKNWKYGEMGVRILSRYRVCSIIQMDAVPLHLFSLLGLNIKMEATKDTDDDHDPEDEAHAESKGWMCLTHCISTAATAKAETVAVQLTAGREVFLSRLAYIP